MAHVRALKPIIHIGPPKTATTSLQDGVIPHLGRPYQIQPDWAQAVARSREFTPPTDLPRDVIVSHESLGDFAMFPPAEIAKRLLGIFDDALIVFATRDPLELFYSLYRQKLLNNTLVDAMYVVKTGTHVVPSAPNQFFDQELAKYRESEYGFFALIRFDATRSIFARSFDVALLPFDLLRASPKAFVQAFVGACRSKIDVDLPHANRSGYLRMASALAEMPEPLPPKLQARYLELYESARLSSDREDFIKSWPQASAVDALVEAFRYWND